MQVCRRKRIKAKHDLKLNNLLLSLLNMKKINCRSTVTAVEANFASAEALHFASF